MALSGGKGNSRSNTATSNTTSTRQSTNNNVDNRVSEGDGAVFGGNASIDLAEASFGDLNLQMTDLGAIAQGLGLARASLDAVSDAAESSISAGQASTAQAYRLADQARQSEASGAINTVLYVGAAVIVVALLVYAAKRRK